MQAGGYQAVYLGDCFYAKQRTYLRVFCCGRGAIGVHCKISSCFLNLEGLEVFLQHVSGTLAHLHPCTGSGITCMTTYQHQSFSKTFNKTHVPCCHCLSHCLPGCQVKLKELGVLGNQQYKIVCLLDHKVSGQHYVAEGWVHVDLQRQYKVSDITDCRFVCDSSLARRNAVSARLHE